MLMEQPLKETTPAVLVAVQPESVPPGPEAIVNAMPCVSVVTVLPPASSIVSVGWVTKAPPPMALAGSVVKAMWLAGPVATVKGVLVALDRCPSVAVSLYPVPAVLMVQPTNVKTPFFSPVDVHPDRVPGPPLVGVPETIPMVTVELSHATGSPAASSTVTTGCVENAIPPLAPPGWVEKTNFVAEPEIPLSAMPTMGLLIGVDPVEP